MGNGASNDGLLSPGNRADRDSAESMDGRADVGASQSRSASLFAASGGELHLGSIGADLSPRYGIFGKGSRPIRRLRLPRICADLRAVVVQSGAARRRDEAGEFPVIGLGRDGDRRRVFLGREI